MDDVSSLFQQSSVNDSDFDKVEYRVFSKESFIIGVHDPEGLSQLRVACLDIVASFTRSYIWQKEPFILTVCEYSHEKNKTTTKGNPHLCGCTRVGDNVEDEWFIVWLLFRISKKFPDVLICKVIFLVYFPIRLLQTCCVSPSCERFGWGVSVD